MKTLIIVLALLSGVVGGEPSHYYIAPNGDTCATNPPSYEVITKPPILTLPHLPPYIYPHYIGENINAAFDSLLLARLVEYERDCYNDSTADSTRFYECGRLWRFDDNERSDTSKATYYGAYGGIRIDDPGKKTIYEVSWSHHPPTFPGFIEWLKKKAGGK